jgi:hypothetical protein
MVLRVGGVGEGVTHQVKADGKRAYYYNRREKLITEA